MQKQLQDRFVGRTGYILQCQHLWSSAQHLSEPGMASAALAMSAALP